MARKFAESTGNPLPEPELPPNRMQLFSYYRPGLKAGHYTIEAEQTIDSKSYENGHWGRAHMRVVNQQKVLPETNPPRWIDADLQEFEVMAPQFSLEPSMINSHYPPDGHQDEGRILPHIVLNDPHFPWERDAGSTVFGGKDPEDPTADPPVFRSMVPWLALMVFDPAELKIGDQTEGDALRIPQFNAARQPQNGAFPMQVKDFLSVPNGVPQASRINFEKGLENDMSELNGDDGLRTFTEAMTAIFPTKSTFLQLFTDVEANKYLAHCRKINTIGFPDAGVEMVGTYSIVVSGRTANLNITQPTTQVVHLVSIEHVDSTLQGVKDAITANAQAGDTRIGMVSLFSWTYTALPPDPINFVSTVRKLVTEMQMLRPNEKLLNDLTTASAPPSTTQKVLQQRLSAGYTLARWRSETGEESAAFNRGPLVPQRVPWPPVDDWSSNSNTSKDYQILDQATGLMDLSYSSAWQLGKVLAIADTAFSAALMRFRAKVYARSTSQTFSEMNGVKSTTKLLKGVQANTLWTADLTAGDTEQPRRIVPANNKVLAPHALNDPVVRPVLAKKVADNVKDQASAGKAIYTEFDLDKPNNADWPIIHTWMSEKLSLSEIPAHIVIPDPSFLPNESLRFFHIDDSWLDCLIDGALSVANHLDRDDDLVRTQIKEVYNYYLANVVPGTKIQPQIPAYGWILRSQIIKVMPDLRITVKWHQPDEREAVCRYTKLDDITILCLLDRQPEELDQIILAQPPHQQRFSLGSDVRPAADPTKNPIMEFPLKKLYTKGAPEDLPWGNVPDNKQPTQTELQGWYDFPSRMVNVRKLATDIHGKLLFGTSNDAQAYVDPIATSSELAMELNDPSYFFVISPKLAWDGKVKPRNRQLWTVDKGQKPAPQPPGDDGSSSNTLGDREAPGVKQDTKTRNTPDDSPARAVASTGLTFDDNFPINPAQPSVRIPANTYQSCFTVEIYPDYKGPPKRDPKSGNVVDPNAYVPTQNTYLFDLIISVRKIPQRKDFNYALSEILISIPHTGGPKNVEPLLDQDYADPRARMLSNQRFTPLLNRNSTHLQVRLIPRSSKAAPSKIINDRGTTEMSFRLAEAQIAKVADPPTVRGGVVLLPGTDKKVPGSTVNVVVWERYVRDTGIYSVPGNGGTGVATFYKIDKKDS